MRENAFFDEYTWEHALAQWKPHWGPKPGAFVAQPPASMPTPQVCTPWLPWLVALQPEPAGLHAGCPVHRPVGGYASDHQAVPVQDQGLHPLTQAQGHQAGTPHVNFKH